jgi:heat shock protein HtpX
MEEKLRESQWKNTLRTGALVLGMLALLILLGYTINGLLGIITAGIVGLVLLVFASQVPSRVIMRMQGGRLLNEQQAPQLHYLVKQLAARAGLPRMPQLYFVPSPAPNAFATGSKSDPAIAVTQGLFQLLDNRQLSGVLAHEISHIRNNDLKLKSMAAIMSRITNAFSFFGKLLIFINLPLLFMGEAVISWWAILILLLAPMVSGLLYMGLSRTREYDADLSAARITGDPEGLASALERLEQLNGQLLRRLLLPRRRAMGPEILRSHPDTSERVRRLRDLIPRYEPRIPLPERFFVA